MKCPVLSSVPHPLTLFSFAVICITMSSTVLYLFSLNLHCPLYLFSLLLLFALAPLLPPSELSVTLQAPPVDYWILLSSQWNDKMWCFWVSMATFWWCQLEDTCWDWQSSELCSELCIITYPHFLLRSGNWNVE